MKIKFFFTQFNLIIAGAFMVLLLSAAANAQVIAFDTAGLTGSEITFNSTTTNMNLNPSQLTRGAGINASTLTDSFNSNNFNVNGTFTDAVTSGDYLQFTVSPKAGFRVSLSTLNANFRRSGTGPNMFQYQYSLDGFATAGVNVGAVITYNGTETNGVSQSQIDLSAISALQNVTFPNVITFRLYGWGATGTAGSFAIGRLAGNDLAIGGTTAAIATAATADISGRVTNGQRGLENITLTLVGGALKEPISISTDNSGRYRFLEIPAGDTYLLTVTSKRYRFSQPTRVISVNESLTDVNFVANGN